MRENFIACLDAVLPIFILILLGYWAKKLGLLDRNDVKKMNKVSCHEPAPKWGKWKYKINLKNKGKISEYFLLCREFKQ